MALKNSIDTIILGVSLLCIPVFHIVLIMDSCTPDPPPKPLTPAQYEWVSDCAQNAVATFHKTPTTIEHCIKTYRALEEIRP